MNYAASHYSFDGKASKVSDRRKQASTASWTASRCNRLLRTITSRIAVLRRLKKLDDQIRTAPILPQEQSLPESRPSSSASEQDVSCPDSPEWIPGRGTRPIKRTYAGRKKLARNGPEQRQTQGSGALFPTPLVKKIMSGPEQRSPFTLASPLITSTQATANRRSTKLPVRPLSSLEEAHRNLLAAFETFLNSTRPIQPPPRTGAGSLLNMCLGKVAHYIELEEEALVFADDEDTQTSDVAFDLYSELETLGSKIGGGWAGLRQVIRMHGIRHIELAIIDGLIPAPLVDRLLGVCDKLAAFHESHVIMEAHSQRSNIDLHAFWFKRAQPCFVQDGSSYWLRCIATLLRTGRLSHQHFTKQTLKVLWKTFLRVLIETDYTAAADFLDAYTVSIKEGRVDGHWNTTAQFRKGLIDVLGMLTAIMLTSEATKTRGNTIRLLHYTTTVHKFGSGSAALDSTMATILLIMVSANSEPRPPIYSPALAEVLVKIQDMRQDLTRKRTSSCTVVDFVCDIANTVEKIGAASGAALLRRMLSSLVRATPTSQISIRRMLERLVHDCAVRYSERTGDRSVIEAVQTGTLSVDSVASNGNICDTASKTRSDYRWEDGLGEWIATTPMACTTVSRDIEVIPTPPLSELPNEKAQLLLPPVQQLTVSTPTPPKSCQEEAMSRDVSTQRAARKPISRKERRAGDHVTKSDIRKPLADIGMPTQNRGLASTTSQTEAKKRKTLASKNGPMDRGRVNEDYVKASWAGKHTNDQADELSLVTPVRPTALQPPRKKVRWDVSCQDKIHTRVLAVKDKSNCNLGGACGLLSPTKPSLEADNMSADELAI